MNGWGYFFLAVIELARLSLAVDEASKLAFYDVANVVVAVLR